nr:MAG TPA: hypothetical protein [Caudoviricetes sp.]
MNVGELKDLCTSILDTLEEFNDTDKVPLVSNTYFLGNSHFFLGVSGCDGGYTVLDESVLRDKIREENEEEEYEND